MCNFQCAIRPAHYTVDDVQLNIKYDVDPLVCSKIIHSFCF